MSVVTLSTYIFPGEVKTQEYNPVSVNLRSLIFKTVLPFALSVNIETLESESSLLMVLLCSQITKGLGTPSNLQVSRRVP